MNDKNQNIITTNDFLDPEYQKINGIAPVEQPVQNSQEPDLTPPVPVDPDVVPIKVTKPASQSEEKVLLSESAGVTPPVEPLISDLNIENSVKSQSHQPSSDELELTQEELPENKATITDKSKDLSSKPMESSAPPPPAPVVPDLVKQPAQKPPISQDEALPIPPVGPSYVKKISKQDFNEKNHQQPSPQGPKSHKLIIILIVVILLAISGGFGYYYLDGTNLNFWPFNTQTETIAPTPISTITASPSTLVTETPSLEAVTTATPTPTKTTIKKTATPKPSATPVVTPTPIATTTTAPEVIVPPPPPPSD